MYKRICNQLCTWVRVISMYKLTTAKRCSSDSVQITFRPPSSCSHRSVIRLFSYVSLVFAKSDLRKDWTTLSGTWSKQTTRKQGGGYQLQFAVPSILIITKSDQLCIHYWKPKFFCVPDYFSDGDEWAHRKMLNFLSVWFTHRKYEILCRFLWNSKGNYKFSCRQCGTHRKAKELQN